MFFYRKASRVTAMELEGRRSSDNHWYHCQVSICSNGRQNVLKVHFSEEDEEYISTPDEARSRLRPASKCLEKGGCRMLQVGDTVLVPSNRMEHGKFGFFEAQIRDINRHKHSSVEMCNCKLEVLCVGAMNEESRSLPASQVRLVDLSSSIHDNPVFCDWICSRLDTSDAESDMHAQLDEQINKITMMTDSFNETSSSTTQLLPDATTRTPRTRSARSQSSSYVKHGRRQRKASSNNTSKSGLPLDKQPRLSPLAARAALAATVLTQPQQQMLLTKPLQQVKPPTLLESKVLRSHSSKYRPDSMPVIAAKNDSRKCRKDPKAKGQKNRVKERGKRNAISGLCYMSTDSYSTKSTRLPGNACGELSVDIPLYQSSFPESSIDMIIDLPILKR